MKADDEIRQLELERDQELRSATREFSRFKRDMRRAVSPDRAVRKHIPVALGVALVAGILLAPAPRYVRDNKGGGSGSMLKRLLRLLSSFIPQLREFVDVEKPAAAEPNGAVETHRHFREKERSPLMALMHRLVKEVNWPMLLTPLLAQLSTRFMQQEPVPESNGKAESEPEDPHPEYSDSRNL